MEHIGDVLRRSRQATPILPPTRNSKPAMRPINGVCPTCKGTGSVHPVSEEGIIDYGSVVPCKCAEPTGEKLKEKLNVNLDNTFENFLPLPGTELAKKAVMGVVKGTRFMVMIYGGVGNGKTHLCQAASIALYEQGKFVRVMSFADMLSTLKSTFNNPDRDYDSILNRYCYAERLIIDDIGAGGSDTEFADKILETIVCARYGRELLTIMTTNREIKELPERVRSRLEDKTASYLVLNKGEDYRPKKRR